MNIYLSQEKFRNPDPFTGAAGAHPIGTGIGAIAGGAASGAVIGLMVGPVGAIGGATAGAIIGGLTGRGIAEKINPTRNPFGIKTRALRQFAKIPRVDDFRHA